MKSMCYQDVTSVAHIVGYANTSSSLLKKAFWTGKGVLMFSPYANKIVATYIRFADYANQGTCWYFVFHLRILCEMLHFIEFVVFSGCRMVINLLTQNVHSFRIILEICFS